MGKSKKTLLNKRVFLSFRKCSNQFFVESFENGKKGEEGIEGGQIDSYWYTVRFDFDSYWYTVRFDSYWKKGEEGIERVRFESYWYTVRLK